MDNGFTQHTGWKQPTPTDGLNNPNLNTLDWMVFLYAWNMVRREPGVYEFIQGNRHFSVELERGQCVFKVSAVAQDLEIGRKRVHKSIEKLQKWYTEMHIEAKPYGLVLTFKRADEILKMDNERNIEGTMKGQRRDNEGTTSKKNVKNVENEKNVKEKRKYIKEKFLEFWNLYPKKVAKTKAEDVYSKIADDHDAIMAGLRSYIAHWTKQATEIQYIPNPTTWLNQRRWEDELATTPVIKKHIPPKTFDKELFERLMAEKGL